MKLKNFILTSTLIASATVSANIYTGNEISEELMSVKHDKKEMTGFKCEIRYDHVKSRSGEKVWENGKRVTKVWNNIEKDVKISTVHCNLDKMQIVETVRTHNVDKKWRSYTQRNVDTALIKVGYSGRNENTNKNNEYKLQMACSLPGLTLTATYDRLNERIETAFYSSQDVSAGNTYKLYETKRNDLKKLSSPVGSSVTFLSNCRPSTK